jgi:hypothetical protein
MCVQISESCLYILLLDSDSWTALTRSQGSLVASQNQNVSG